MPKSSKVSRPNFSAPNVVPMPAEKNLGIEIMKTLPGTMPRQWKCCMCPRADSSTSVCVKPQASRAMPARPARKMHLAHALYRHAESPSQRRERLLVLENIGFLDHGNLVAKIREE